MRSSVSLSVWTSLVWHWAQIAVKHEAEAHEVRAQGEINNDELQASMVCIAAAAFALDAIYAEQREVVPEELRKRWRDQGTARWKQIYEEIAAELVTLEQWRRTSTVSPSSTRRSPPKAQAGDALNPAGGGYRGAPSAASR